jgi:hypothetical protein
MLPQKRPRSRAAIKGKVDLVPVPQKLGFHATISACFGLLRTWLIESGE